MFEHVGEAAFISGEHEVLHFWNEKQIFRKLRAKNRGKKRWSFLDGPITANNPMGVHHAWGRTYKDAFQRYFAMTGHDQRYQNGLDCQGLWVEVEVEKELGLGTKKAIHEFGVDRFVNECKKRVLRFAARQTEQSIRLGYWMDWDNPETLRQLAEHIGRDEPLTITTPSGKTVTDAAHRIVARLGNPEWGGSYFTFSTENNETIWTFLKKCFRRQKIYRGYDVMPWSGRGGSAYSQMEVADGRRLTVHKSCFVRFPLKDRENEYLLVWTTTPWTLTSNVAAAVNPDLEYVRLRSKKDGAIYYFAKDNLDYKRLEREFKEGFGRPEWQWPKDVPKLKTIAQIFKEQGGYEILDTIKGSEMIGWQYEGPFDDLPAQQQPGGFPKQSGKPKAESGPTSQADDLSSVSSVFSSPDSSAASHRVIDGGRDSKGNPHVVAGEGTGIVHIAPGCGDVDHQSGEELGLPSIAPLDEDGTFLEGFGEFTGKEAIDPSTAELVFEKLREKGLLVYVEPYPHIYPHCWRTGDELVFRLVDEWFINMDWRDEIKEVVKTIRWLPPEIQGQERELEWLENMRDWMISKKRFWGLALPIWVNPDDPTDFEVIGSLAELKERAVEGWDEFEGNTPHRPWIDRVKIRSQKTGAILSRIVDVGNPWLDAGIVPFSTMHYNTDRAEWEKWYPADFVTECFPGQFRNWFYSLLAMATMMRYDETDDPAEKRPFKTLLGHRLVMNEEGQPMHKSDGTAIWFEEAAEQLGVDTMRWMYLAQNPAQDLRFGTRHPDEPVTLQTPEGPIHQTKEGLPTCKVTSRPSDEVRRQVLIPLWNSYAFFGNYARLDEFDPSLPPVPMEQRPEIDRWILSNLQALIGECRAGFEEYNTPRVCAAAAGFIDDLSNWYIRRNRRRFWRSRKTGLDSPAGDLPPASHSQPATLDAHPSWDADKLAAYQTLYEVLVTLTKVLAPLIPFLSERMYQNLVAGGPLSVVGCEEAEADNRQQTTDPPESVHLCDYPELDSSLLDPGLNRRMAVAQRLVKLGHKLREEASLRVRQPLAEMRFVAGSEAEKEAAVQLADVICEELNIKRLIPCNSLDELVQHRFKPNLKTLGPKYGKLLGPLRQRIEKADPAELAPLRNGREIKLTVNDVEVSLSPEDVLIETEQAPGWISGEDRSLQAALCTQLTPELQAEGMRNDFIRHVQQRRKEADLQIQDRIRIFFHTEDDAVRKAVEEWADYIRTETLADEIIAEKTTPADNRPVRIGSAKVHVWIERA